MTPSQTIADRLTRLEEKFDSLLEMRQLEVRITDERWSKVEMAMNYGDAQGQSALMLLSGMVERQEENQRDLGKRVRVLEDQSVSIRTVAVVAATALAGGGGIATAIFRAIGS